MAVQTPLRSAVVALTLLLLGAVAHAGTTAPSRQAYQQALDLRQNWSMLTRDVAWPARWLGSEQFYYRKSVEGGFTFVLVDARTLLKKPAFDHRQLADALGKLTGERYPPTQLPFDDVVMLDEGGSLRVGIDDDTYRCTLDDYVCAEVPSPWLKGARPRAFGVVRDMSVPASTTAKVSPDGVWEALVSDHNLHVRKLVGGKLITLSRDGRAEDFYDPDTLVWSPDSSRVAIYRVVPAARHEVTRVETSPTDQKQPRNQTQLYPKPGDPVDIDRPMLFEVATAKAIAIDQGLFEQAYQLSSPHWRSDSATLSIDYTRRGHQLVRVVEVDARSGATRAPISERTDTFIHAERAFRHDVNGLGDEIIWSSERDGWRHLYLHDGRGENVSRPITQGDWIVREVLQVDDKARQIWFVASGVDAGSDPYYTHTFRVDFDGGNLTRLTPEDAWHDVSLSPDRRWYVDLFSTVSTAPVMLLRRADGSTVEEIERGDISALVAAGWKAPEPFVAKGRDGLTDIWGLIVRPRDYDPRRRYPVIENIYAGPHDSFVPKAFWPFGYHSGGDKVSGMQAQADMGFIVVQMDGMGTANRSKAFHDVAWKNLGDSGFPDRILWHQALAAKDPSYDISRVGIYGASAGGQSALGALLFHPEFYDVAVAYNGCYDNRMDKISWNEQWMGWPVDESYARASGVDNAGRLQGKLLMILGEQDSNVDPASTMQVADALIRAEKDFDLLSVPGGGHTVGRSTGPIDYVHRRQFDFFVRHLLGAETPDWNRDKPPSSPPL